MVYVKEFVVSSEQIWTNLALHRLILYSEWVPSEWELKQLIKHHNNPQVIVKTPVKQDAVCLTNKKICTSQGINWRTGVVWITCGLLCCFYQLFGLSFWRHPFTAEDPLVNKWCNAKFLQICSEKETNSSTSWMARWWVNFKQISFLGEQFILKCENNLTLLKL